MMMSFSKHSREASVEGHSKLVRALRWAFPVIGIVLLVGVVFWPNFMKSALYPHVERAIRKANFVLNPRIFSTDDQGQPYTIEAKTAEQVGEMSAKLEKPLGKFILDDGTKVLVKANRGDLKKNEDSLKLKGSVYVKSENGYELNAPSAKVDLKTRSTETFEPVYGKGPAGHIKSKDGVKISADGTVAFKGVTRMIIEPKKAKEPAHG